MGISLGQINHFNQNKNHNNINNLTDIRALKRGLTDKDKGTKKDLASQYGMGNSKVVNNSIEYANTLSAQRTSKKDTSLKLKKLKYDFKGMSAQIMRSKTSNSAKQVASKARREVIRLKRQRQNGEFDDEELQAAIVHAQSMERIAKKKAKHLMEEEMVKTTGGACAGDIEEEEKVEGTTDDLEELDEEQYSEESEELEELYEESFEEIAEQSEDLESFIGEIEESMKELLEDTGLEDLVEELSASVDREMDPADFKMMKIKHRAKENKELAKADGEYLKAMFEKYEKEMHSEVQGVSSLSGVSAGMSNGMNPGSAMGQNSVDILI